MVALYVPFLVLARYEKTHAHETQVVAIYNGGPPGVIYELCVSLLHAQRLSAHLTRIAASVFYWLIAASIAELASAMPSSGGGSFNRNIPAPAAREVLFLSFPRSHG